MLSNKQRFPVIDFAVFSEHLIAELVDKSLVGSYLCGNQSGYSAQIIIDDGLTAKAELFAVGFEPGVYTLIHAGYSLKLAVLRDFLHLTISR